MPALRDRLLFVLNKQTRHLLSKKEDFGCTFATFPMAQQYRYFILNKPHTMVSQFIGEDKVPMLGALNFDFPEGIHAVGRLDSHSEGLLILTTNKKLTKLLFESKTPHRRKYLVRVRGRVGPEQLKALRTGVSIPIKNGEYYTTPCCAVDIVEQPEGLFPHQLEMREYVAHTWLSISLYEGKHRQVRKMVSAVDRNCQRLIRVAIEDLELGSLAPGEIREIGEDEIFRQLKIDESRRQ